MSDLGTGASREGLLHQSDASIIEHFALEGCIIGFGSSSKRAQLKYERLCYEGDLEVTRLVNIGGTDAHRLGEVG